MKKSIQLLVIEDEEFDVRRIKNTIQLSQETIEIRDIVSNGRDALALLKKHSKVYDVIVMDYQIAGGLMGEQLIEEIKKINQVIQILVMTKMTIQHTDFNFANKLLKAGAFWFCTKYPGDIEEYIYQPTDLILSIVNAYQKKKLELEHLKNNAKLNKNISEILEKKEIIGQSQSTLKLRNKIGKYAKTNANIIIYGQSGTGKELVATNIHYLSERKYENFITINCASLPAELIESELFGFEKGSFTGAKDKREGYFEQAHKGTIFLDEIGEFPLSAQAKLLRVLQEGEIDKIGRKKRHEVDVRVIAATNKNLMKMVEKGKFREDLYYRLNVLRLSIQPLKEHRDDILPLVDHFITEYAFKIRIIKPKIGDEAKQILFDHEWPGNVREVMRQNKYYSITNGQAMFGNFKM